MIVQKRARVEATNLGFKESCNIIKNWYDQEYSTEDCEFENKRKIKMLCGSFYLPKENEDRPLGEDALFVYLERQTIGVADGVGGWAKKGVDAGEYARELMLNAFLSVHNSNKTKNADNIDCEIEKPTRKRKAMADRIGAVDPKMVLQEAYAMTKKTIGLQGSSTACILTLHEENGVLLAANVGDSGFLLFRNNKCLFSSPTQQHRFNCPYQLGTQPGSDGPESALEIKVQTMPGDIIVLGTDGLLDNVFPAEIEELLAANYGTGSEDGDLDCELFASVVTQKAYDNYSSEGKDSPFSKQAKKAGYEHVGGKEDDITVIVAQVVAMAT